MSKYMKYPSYRDSGIEWLGDVPEGWENTYLKYIADVNMGQSPSSSTYNNENNGVEFLQGNADFQELYPIARTFSTDPKKMSKEKDILFTVRAPVGAMNISDKKYAIGRGLCAISATKYSDRFFLWYLMSVVKTELDTISTGSTYEAVSVEQVNNSIVVLPPLQEQQTIANYLDTATAKIDTLIEKQTKLIALLKEKRQAVISTAVTRGLDNTVAMKDSEVEWLGEIPEHWEAVSLKYISRITLGKMLTSSDKGNMKLKPYLKAKNLRWMKVDVRNTDNMWFSDDELKSLRLKNNDLLVSEGGEVGRACMWNNELDECYIQNSVNRVQFTKRNPEFFLYQFFAAGHYGYFDSIVNKISIAHLTKEKLGDAKFVVTPIKEQEVIVNYLDDKTSKIDKLINKSTKAIDLLKEKRTALISSVVTGKIDVRESV